MEKEKVFVELKVEFLSSGDKGLDILGDEISSFKRVSFEDIPESFSKSKDGLLSIYTKEGVSIVYDDDNLDGTNENLVKNMVDGDAMYVSEDIDDTIYFEFSKENYEKFVYLFENNKKLYRLSD